MRNAGFILLVSILSMTVQAQPKIWTTNDATVSFFSNAPLENIKAVSKNGASALNTATGEIVFKVRNTSFQFRKRLMQTHFNESYMESDKYPVSEFKGKIQQAPTLNEPGIYEVTVEGILTIHGVAKFYRTIARIAVHYDSLTASCDFDVRVADHDIRVPAILGRNIAEVVNVHITARYRQE